MSVIIIECKGLGKLSKLETDTLSFDFSAHPAKTMAGPSNLFTFPIELIFHHYYCLLCFTLSLLRSIIIFALQKPVSRCRPSLSSVRRMHLVELHDKELLCLGDERHSFLWHERNELVVMCRFIESSALLRSMSSNAAYSSSSFALQKTRILPQADQLQLSQVPTKHVDWHSE